MKKNTKIIVSIAVIVILILGGYFLWQVFYAGEAVTGTLSDLAHRTGPSVCTLSYDDDNVTSSGTVYVSDGRLRGDFNFYIKPTGQRVESHFVREKDVLYTWNPENKTGTMSASSSPDVSGGTNPNQPYTYRCTDMDVPETEFSLPTDVSFYQAQ
jgi:hypothetical protein